MGLGKPGRLRVDQPTITRGTRPSSGRIHPLFALIIAALSKTAGGSAFDEGGRRLRQVGT